MENPTTTLFSGSPQACVPDPDGLLQWIGSESSRLPGEFSGQDWVLLKCSVIYKIASVPNPKCRSLQRLQKAVANSQDLKFTLSKLVEDQNYSLAFAATKSLVAFQYGIDNEHPVIGLVEKVSLMTGKMNSLQSQFHLWEAIRIALKAPRRLERYISTTLSEATPPCRCPKNLSESFTHLRPLSQEQIAVSIAEKMIPTLSSNISDHIRQLESFRNCKQKCDDAIPLTTTSFLRVLLGILKLRTVQPNSKEALAAAEILASQSKPMATIVTNYESYTVAKAYLSILDQVVTTLPAKWWVCLESLWSLKGELLLPAFERGLILPAENGEVTDNLEKGMSDIQWHFILRKVIDFVLACVVQYSKTSEPEVCQLCNAVLDFCLTKLGVYEAKHPAARLQQYLFTLYEERDDLMIRCCNKLLSIRKNLLGWNPNNMITEETAWTVLFDASSLHEVFEHLVVRCLCDHTVMFDWLTSNETTFLSYFVGYLRDSIQPNPRHHQQHQSCDLPSSYLDNVLPCLVRLRLQVERCDGRGEFPYNCKPLLQRMTRWEQQVESAAARPDALKQSTCERLCN